MSTALLPTPKRTNLISSSSKKWVCSRVLSCIINIVALIDGYCILEYIPQRTSIISYPPGNDVCNSRGTLDDITKPEDFLNSTLARLEYLDTKLANVRWNLSYYASSCFKILWQTGYFLTFAITIVGFPHPLCWYFRRSSSLRHSAWSDPPTWIPLWRLLRVHEWARNVFHIIKTGKRNSWLNQPYYIHGYIQGFYFCISHITRLSVKCTLLALVQ